MAGFPERLRILINENGMDVKTFVEDFNAKGDGTVSVSNTTMSSLLRGKSECRYGLVIAFAKYFHVSTDYLLGLTDVKVADVNFRQAAYTFGIDPDIGTQYAKIVHSIDNVKAENSKESRQADWIKMSMYALNFLLYDEIENRHLQGKNQSSSLLEEIASQMDTSQRQMQDPESFKKFLASLPDDGKEWEITFPAYMQATTSGITNRIVNLYVNQTFKNFCKRWKNFPKDYALYNSETQKDFPVEENTNK